MENKLIGRISSYYTSVHATEFFNYKSQINLDDITKRFNIVSINESSVSYVGIVLTYPLKKVKRPLQTMFTEFEKAELLQYSMMTVLNNLLSEKDKLTNELLLPVYSPNYNKQLACFVTINNQKYDHIDDKQRGCIGTTDIKRATLLENIRYFSLQSAFFDNRYSKITFTELVDLQTKKFLKYFKFKKDFSITVLNKQKHTTKDKFLKKINLVIGKDAVTLIVDYDSSTYITNDAKLHKLTKEIDILKMLCRKMGKKESCIKSSNLKIEYHKVIL